MTQMVRQQRVSTGGLLVVAMVGSGLIPRLPDKPALAAGPAVTQRGGQ